jgi:hypothetical protein
MTTVEEHREQLVARWWTAAVRSYKDKPETIAQRKAIEDELVKEFGSRERQPRRWNSG